LLQNHARPVRAPATNRRPANSEVDKSRTLVPLSFR